MKGLISSSIVRGLAQPLISAGTVSTLVCFYEGALADGTLPANLPSFLMPTAPFDLTSFALSLLLVFRTNSSYDRWLETITVWGNIANRARDTLRQLVSHARQRRNGSPAPRPLAAAVRRWVVAYVRSLKFELVEDADLQSELAGLLGPSELQSLLAARHKPSFALSVLTELCAAADLRESHRVRVDENLTFLEDAVGSCERILRTPIPLSYTRHSSRFMVIWLTALPLGLWQQCGWGTVPLTLVISFLLLGIEEIGVQIEEPFSILPLEELCAEMEADLAGILQEASIAREAAREAAGGDWVLAADLALGLGVSGNENGNGSGVEHGGEPMLPLVETR
jgi:ion channel-forming bestrophin family protein